MEDIKCPSCGESIPDERIDKAMEYAFDTGFDEGYEAAMYEVEAGRGHERLHAKSAGGV